MRGQSFCTKGDGSFAAAWGRWWCWGDAAMPQDQAYLDWNKIYDLGVKKISDVKSLFCKRYREEEVLPKITLSKSRKIFSSMLSYTYGVFASEVLLLSFSRTM